MTTNGRGNNTRTAIYLRQSKDRYGNELAVSRQRADCVKLCEQRGWMVLPEYLDNDRSASGSKPRPAYLRLIADIEADKVDAVVAWDADRLHRHPMELEAFIDLADRKRLALATVGGDFDLSSPTGRAQARNKGTWSRLEMEQKSWRSRRAAMQKAQLGLPSWRDAFGYRNGDHKPTCRRNCTDPHPEPDPVTAPLVKQAYEHVLAGGTIIAMIRLFNEKGALAGRWLKPKDENGDPIKEAAPEWVTSPWGHPRMADFLRAPRNAGLVTYSGQCDQQTDLLRGVYDELLDADGTPIRGTWTPLVDEATWRAVQDILRNGKGQGRHGPPTLRKHLLSSVIFCGKCGAAMHGTMRSNYTTKYPAEIIYGCIGCRGAMIRSQQIEPEILQLVSDRLGREDAGELLKADERDDAEAQAQDKERNDLLAKLDQLAIDMTNGLLTARQVKISTDIYQARLAELDRQQQDIDRVRLYQQLELGTAGVRRQMMRLITPGAEIYSPDRFRAIVDDLYQITIMPAGRGRRNFDRDKRIKVTGKR